MKRILNILIIVSVVFVCSCNNKSNSITTGSPIEYDFEKVVNNDIAIYRGSNFYRSQIEFDTNILLDSAKVIQITNTFEKRGECIQINHLPDGTRTVNGTNYYVTFKNDPINYEDSVGLSLRGILNLIRSDSNYYWLNKRTVTLCQPKGRSSLYIVGDGNLIINAQTGKIEK